MDQTVVYFSIMSLRKKTPSGESSYPEGNRLSLAPPTDPKVTLDVTLSHLVLVDPKKGWTDSSSSSSSMEEEEEEEEGNNLHGERERLLESRLVVVAASRDPSVCAPMLRTPLPLLVRVIEEYFGGTTSTVVPGAIINPIGTMIAEDTIIVKMKIDITQT
ncbi:uncharacterized protein LOC143033238 [Oratosquilla oratoria]|uniref:uncharacterized protein LOC143033238 n=1 Tax=Oratosquilla oratoria TaxID=337810 RepID=UPI003F75E1C3